MIQQCKTKAAYPTRAAAFSTMQSMTKRSSFGRGRKGQGGSTLNVYRCPYCSQFHIGNTK